MTRLSAPSLLLALGCMGPCNTTDDRGDYLAEQMAEYGCWSKAPCNFLAHNGPGVYSCTGSYPDSSTVEDASSSRSAFESSSLYGIPWTKPHYIIYSDGTGEPDAEVNRNDLFPPKADPRMLALQKRGEELGCRTVNVGVYDMPLGSEEWMQWEAPQYSCVISTCQAWVEGGEVKLRKTPNLSDGA